MDPSGLEAQAIWNGCGHSAKVFALYCQKRLLGPSPVPFLSPNQVHLSHRDSPGRGPHRVLQSLDLVDTIRLPLDHLAEPWGLLVVPGEDLGPDLSSRENQLADSQVQRFVQPKSRQCTVLRSAYQTFAVIGLSVYTESRLHWKRGYVKT